MDSMYTRWQPPHSYFKSEYQKDILEKKKALKWIKIKSTRIDSYVFTIRCHSTQDSWIFTPAEIVHLHFLNPFPRQMLPKLHSPESRLYTPTFLHPGEKNGERKTYVESTEREAEEEPGRA